jgi:protein LSM14
MRCSPPICFVSLLHARLGSRISLISKKNIRYEGILYSINEADATVALQDVKSFGTEGRELLDATGFSTFVPPNDQVHAYLLFRGQDIKDLHVHEKTNDVAPTPVEAAAVTPPPAAPTAARGDAKPIPPPSQAPPRALDSKPTQIDHKTKEKRATATERRPARSQKQQQQQQQQQQGENTKRALTSKNENDTKQPEGTGVGESKEAKPASSKVAFPASTGANRNSQNMVGTGASLLNRNLRGAKGDKGQ